VGQLDGLVALVTGGSRGIGREICKLFASEGARVMVVDVALEGARETAGICGENALAFKMDVSNAEEVEKVVEEIVSAAGKIDILVNNAGITRDNLLLRMSDEEWDTVIAVNLRGVFLCTRAVAREMLRQRSGSIINISSVSGLHGNAGQANYSASKAGIVGLTKTAAKELASRNIRVNAVAPGFIRTEMTEVLPQKVKDSALAGIPLKRFGEAGDVAKAILFLASPSSSYITGQVIVVDGGMAI